VHAHRYGLARVDGATVAATAAVLGAVWTVEFDYGRMAALTEETAWVLSHYRPAPDHVEVTRTATTLCTAYGFTMHGPRAMRALVALRKLAPAPPDTLVRALATVLRAAPEMDCSMLTELCDSGEPLLAGVANGVASFLWENAGDPDGALQAAQRMVEAFERRQYPWIRIVASSRLAELHMHAGQGAEALVHLRTAWRIQDGLGWPDLMGIEWAMALASLQRGALDEAERWVARVGVGLVDDSIANRSVDHAVRGELMLARGEVDTGLAQWRHAVTVMTSTPIPDLRVEPGMEPWALELKTVAVVAHAQHGRLDLVEEIVDDLPHAVSALLTDAVADQVSYLTGLPLCGAVLLALAMADLARGEQTGDQRAIRSGVRLVALAERFRYLRQFQPTMSVDRARHAAEHADRPAYAEAVSSYADLGHDELRATALAALRERP
jgi:hypothetical protein